MDGTAFRAPRKWSRILLWVAAAAVILFLLYLFPFLYTVRAVWLPWQPAESVRFHARDFRGGEDVSASEFDATTSIGHAMWPDGNVYNGPMYDPTGVIPGSIPTVIIVETPRGSGHYRYYGLVGGP